MGKKIFIADDESGFVSTLRSRLEFEGFEITTAPDGKAALEMIPDEKPDLVLLTHDAGGERLPGVPRTEGNSDTSSIPILMLTAKSQESDRFWGKELEQMPMSRSRSTWMS